MEKESQSDGTPFSRTYSKRGELQRDSLRFRDRLGAYCSEHLEGRKAEIVSILHQELGLDVPVVRIGYYSITEFFRTSDLRDVLDSITHIWRVLMKGRSPDMAYCWLEFVQRVFEEENLGYRVDGEGRVHHSVDGEIERDRLATLRCLEDPRYAGVAAAFKAALQKLDSHPPDTKGTALCMLEAIEILFRLITNSEPKTGLDSSEVRNALEPTAKKIYQDETSRTVAQHLLDGLCNWVKALEIYRDGRKAGQHISPPVGLAHHIISSGSSYLRWLVGFDLWTR